MDIVDIHSHILPGVDDGSASLEDTFRLLDHAVDQGLTEVIATPHYSRRNTDPARIEHLRSRWRELREAARERYEDLTIYLGQELYYHEELPEHISRGLALPLADSSYYLVEFSVGESWDMILRGLRRIAGLGVIPVLAHMERYGSIDSLKKAEAVKDAGAVIQVNYDSLAGGLFDPETRRSRRLVKSGLADVVASDMHRPDFRPFEIGAPMKVLRKLTDEARLEKLVQENPRRILSDREIR